MTSNNFGPSRAQKNSMDPGRARLMSQAREVTKFSQPRTKTYFRLCTYHLGVQVHNRNHMSLCTSPALLELVLNNCSTNQDNFCTILVPRSQAPLKILSSLMVRLNILMRRKSSDTSELTEDSKISTSISPGSVVAVMLTRVAAPTRNGNRAIFSIF